MATDTMVSMNAKVRWAAELAHVREVSLLGSADALLWRKVLPSPLVLEEHDQRARIMITAADAKYRGIRFREVSFCLLVSVDREGVRSSGAYLLAAFNSRRFFAFCERVLFSAPYQCGVVTLAAAVPASLQLSQGGEVAFEAKMQVNPASGPRGEVADGTDGWRGPVFFSAARKADAQTRFFFADIRGRTETYPFVSGEDHLLINPVRRGDIFSALLESDFTATRWMLRADASHAKSKTYRDWNDWTRGGAAE